MNLSLALMCLINLQVLGNSVAFFHAPSSLNLDVPKKRPSSSRRLDSKLHVSSLDSQVDLWKEFEQFREGDLEEEQLAPFFRKRPGLIVNRLIDVSKTVYGAQKEWNHQDEEMTGHETTSTRSHGNLKAKEEIDATHHQHANGEPNGADNTAHSSNTSDKADAYVDGESIFVKSELSAFEMERHRKLCDAVSSLGPLAVKLGQTLSERADLVGVDAARALKNLQMNNKPFDNQLAYATLHDSLDYWDGPLAPGINFEYYDDFGDDSTSNTDGSDVNDTNDVDGNSGKKSVRRRIDPNGPTLFKEMTVDPIACASLGQVYKATMHDGREVAIKVQRPDALTTLAKDAQCFRTVYRAKSVVEKVKGTFVKKPSRGDMEGGMTEDEVRGGSSTAVTVLDRVAKEVKMELDYRIEAENSVRFRDSLKFLGFVTTPNVVQATDRILITEWIPGRHLKDLSTEEGLAMTQMAVQACTASMVLTGFVHADPHQGNLMLHDDGRVVFLDFGLMSEVDGPIMEGFARGISALLSENWPALTDAFIDIGFVKEPIMHRAGVNDLWQVSQNYQRPELAAELAEAMMTTEGGGSRFGALATVIAKKLSPNWLVTPPPYVILLCRTFLTLEGMAAEVDPNFNIYDVAMPWAVKRTLAPSSDKGAEVLRSTLLTEDNKIQWQRFIEMVPTSDAKQEASITVATSASASDNKRQERAQAKQEATKDAIRSLMGSTDGKTLRKSLKDLDSIDLLHKLCSKEGQSLLKMISKTMLSKRAQNDGHGIQEANTPIESTMKRPVSVEYNKMALQQRKWKNKVVRVLVNYHLRRCLLTWRGLMATSRLTLVGVKVFTATFIQNWFQKRRKLQPNSP